MPFNCSFNGKLAFEDISYDYALVNKDKARQKYKMGLSNKFTVAFSTNYI